MSNSPGWMRRSATKWLRCASANRWKYWALWINALAIGKRFSSEWGPLFEKAQQAFGAGFGTKLAKELFDVSRC